MKDLGLFCLEVEDLSLSSGVFLRTVPRRISHPRVMRGVDVMREGYTLRRRVTTLGIYPRERLFLSGMLRMLTRDVTAGDNQPG